MKLTKKDFIAIANYLNMINRNMFTESEVLENANDWYSDYEYIIEHNCNITDSCLIGLLDELEYCKDDSEVYKVYYALKPNVDNVYYNELTEKFMSESDIISEYNNEYKQYCNSNVSESFTEYLLNTDYIYKVDIEQIRNIIESKEYFNN